MLLILLSPCLAASSAESLTFLEENVGLAGVRTLCSGLQYRVLHNGTSERSPTLETPIMMHWEGYALAAWQADGPPFYTTRAGDGPMPLTAAEGVCLRGSNPGCPRRHSRQIDAPSAACVAQVSAWEEALPRMAVGDKWEVYAPSELAYGDDGMEEASGAVAPGEAVVYVLELLSMEGAGVPRKPPPRDGAAEAAKATEAAEGAGALHRLRSVRELRSWAEQAGEQRTLVLALLRAPSNCLLREAVAAEAEAHGSGGQAAFAFSSESAYVPSALERGIGLAAPAASPHSQTHPRPPATGSASHPWLEAPSRWLFGRQSRAKAAWGPLCRHGASPRPRETRYFYHSLFGKMARSTFRPTAAPLGTVAPCCSRRRGATRRHSRSRRGWTRAGVPSRRPRRRSAGGWRPACLACSAVWQRRKNFSCMCSG